MKKQYVDNWKDLTPLDIGTRKWMQIFNESRKNYSLDRIEENKLQLDCFDLLVNPMFPQVQRSIQHSSTIYYLAIDQCDKGKTDEDCSGNGKCSLSRCTCKNGYHGLACDKINCPSSLCYVDIDTIEIQYCSHCSQNGRCNVKTGECSCVDEEGNFNGYYGKDCSMRKCKNNCGNVEGEDPIGECIQDFPFAYCRCFEENKRGGDDCSKIFCLNDCAGHG